MAHWNNYLAENGERFFNELVELLSIPSVSTVAEHAQDVRRAAEWTQHRLSAAGFKQTQIMETGGHPLVYAEWTGAPGKPTILLYGHFDVQPVDPLELWFTPPFTPSVRDGKIFARGASDMKTSLLTAIIGCEALLQTTGTLPVNVKVLFEGEEEIGSPSLERFIQQHQDLLACDMVVSADSGQSDHHAILPYGSRGIVALQIDVQSATSDLHSGNGGLVPNANHALIRLLDSMRSADGTILVEGFYSDVEAIDAAEKARIAAADQHSQEFLNRFKIKGSMGEPEFTPAERRVARPTLEVNGIWGGFQGQGAKTVIPCEAHAKITCRLVPGQSPDKVYELMEAHIQKHTPDVVSYEVTRLPGQAEPYLMPLDHPGLQASRRALLELFGHEPIPVREGGTVPFMGLMLKHLGVYTVSYGFSGEHENIHAPNEFFKIPNFSLGQRGFCVLFEELAKEL